MCKLIEANDKPGCKMLAECKRRAMTYTCLHSLEYRLAVQPGIEQLLCSTCFVCRPMLHLHAAQGLPSCMHAGLCRTATASGIPQVSVDRSISSYKDINKLCDLA